MIAWDAVREVGIRSTCACVESQCHCVYEDFKASMAYKELAKKTERVRFR